MSHWVIGTIDAMFVQNIKRVQKNQFLLTREAHETRMKLTSLLNGDETNRKRENQIARAYYTRDTAGGLRE